MPFADWKQDATPDEQVVAVCFNRRLYAEWAAASEALDLGRHGDDVDVLAAKVVELTEKVEADREAHRFVFRTLPYSVWRDLLEQHQDDNGGTDTETFSPAVVATSCVEPELAVDDALWLREHLPRGEFARLSQAAMNVNVGGSSIPKSGVAIARMLASELRSTTQLELGLL